MPYSIQRFSSFLILLLLIGLIPGATGESQSLPPVSEGFSTVTLDRAAVKTDARPALNVSGSLLALTTVNSRDEMVNQAARSGLQLTARGVRTTIIATDEASASRLTDPLLQAGASDILRYKHWLDATIPVSSLEIAGQLPGIALIQPVVEVFPLQQEPVTIGGSNTTTVSGNQAQIGQPNTGANSPAVSTLPNTTLPNTTPVNTGTYTSAGVAASNADDWHAAGITGRDIVVGVLDGFANLDAAQASGDLPGDPRITTLGTLNTSTAHGTAVAEIIYDMAPDVDFILSSPTTAVEMATQIIDMADEGADIISSSIGFFNTEPGDGTGPVSDAITTVTNTYDVLVTQAAGNQANYNWQGVFDDSNNGNDYHEFANGEEINRIYVQSGTYIELYLRWNSWPLTSRDYDILLFREDASLAGGRERVGTGGANYQDGDDPPVEKVTHTATRTGYYSWSVFNFSEDTTPSVIDVMGYRTPPFEKNIPAYSLVDPATSSAVFGVAAVNATNNARPSYSSVGPALKAGGNLGPNGNQQPRLAGYTAVETYTTQPSLFDGTSAATPHVAGAAALIRSNFPSYNVNDIRTYLEGRAIDEGATGYDYQHGAGRLHLGSPPSVNLLSNSSFNNGRTGWLLFGDLNFAVTSDEVFEFYRLFPGWQTPSVFQIIEQGLTSGTPLALQLELGNTSNSPKGVHLMVRPSAYGDAISCGVTIPPNTSLTQVTLKGNTAIDWTDIMVQIQAMDPDELPAVRVDNVSLKSDPAQPAGYDCSGLDITSGTQMVRNPSFTNGRFHWGLWGDFDFSVTNEAMHIYRPAGATRQGALFQLINYHLPANAPIYTRLSVSNTGANAKAVQIVLTDRWRETFSCVFNIPANTAPTDIIMRDTTSIQWGRPMLIVYLQASNMTNDPELIIDDVSIHYRPNNPITSDSCLHQAYTSLSDGSVIESASSVKPEPIMLPESNSLPDMTIPEAPENPGPPVNGEPPTIPGF